MILTSEYQYIGRSNAVSCPSGYGYYILVYAKATADQASGSHRVSVKTRLACNVNASFYALTTSGEAAAGGVTAYSWTKQQIPYDYWGDSSSLTEGGYTYPRWTELQEGTAVVPGGFGPDREITITASWVMNSTSSSGAGWFPNTGEYARASIPVTLSGIAGASAISSAGNVTLGGNCSVKWTPMAAGFRYKLRFSMGAWSGESGLIHPNTTASYTYTGYTVPLEAARQLPNDPSGTMTVTLYTYSDSGGTVSAGEADSEVFTVYVPENSGTKPDISLALSAVGPVAGVYVQGLSKVQGSFSGEGKYGASISGYTMTVQGRAYGDPWLSDYVTQAGSVTVKGTVTDSRGFTNITEQTIAVISYGPPSVLVSLCGRCDGSGNLTDSGTNLRITASRDYSKVISGGVQKNFCLLRLRWKLSNAEDSGYSGWIVLRERTDSADSFDGVVGGISLDLKSSYTVQIGAADDIGRESIVTLAIGTEEIYMHRTQNALGLGKYVEEEKLLDCAWNAWFREEVRIGEAGVSLRDYIKNIIAGG